MEMVKLYVKVTRDIADELEKQADGIGKSAAVMEALCFAWNLQTGSIPQDQRRKGSERHGERKEYGWRE